MLGMDDLKKIMYGVTDFALMRTENGYFVDRTDLISELELATTGTDAPVTRLFITGVSPVTLDDVTSGFNIGTNVSVNPAFSELTGFTRDDLREMLEYYRANAGLATTEAIRVKAKDFGTVVSRTAGQFLCWAHVRAGSPVTVSAGGENFKLEPNGKPGEMVWMKAGNVMLPAGYTAVSAPKDDVDEIVLVNNPEWSPERK